MTLLLLLLACPPAPRATPEQALVFPHAQDFELPAAHGPALLESGLATCQECHEQSSAPSCASCHEAYPHAEGWIHGHGEASRTDGATCSSCHEEPGLRAAEQLPCTQCHASFPHPAQWRESHGATALTLPDMVGGCTGCHEHSSEGDQACASCHEVFPHSADFDHPAAFEEDPSTCASCHAEGAQWDGGRSKVACARCHQSFPHGAAWKQEHMAVSGQVGEATCMVCHEQGDGPDTMPATCSTACHGSAP